MDTVTSVVATGAVVGLGRWSQEKEATPKMYIGLGILAAFFAVFESANEKLAQQFALLVLITAVLIYGVDIGNKVGGMK